MCVGVDVRERVCACDRLWPFVLTCLCALSSCLVSFYASLRLPLVRIGIRPASGMCLIEAEALLRGGLRPLHGAERWLYIPLRTSVGRCGDRWR